MILGRFLLLFYFHNFNQTYFSLLIIFTNEQEHHQNRQTLPIHQQ